MSNGEPFKPRFGSQRHWSLLLPHAPLPEALAICLDMVGSRSYERAAISWHTRFCGYPPDLTFADAQAALEALAAFPDSRRLSEAAELATLSRRYGLEEVAEVVETWLAARQGLARVVAQRPRGVRATRPPRPQPRSSATA